MDLELEPVELYEPIRYILDLGGKRIRPMLALLSYSVFQPDPDKIVGIATGIEINRSHLVFMFQKHGSAIWFVRYPKGRCFIGRRSGDVPAIRTKGNRINPTGGQFQGQGHAFDQVLALCAAVEAELSELEPEEAAEFRRDEMGPGGLYVSINHKNHFMR